MMPLLRVVFAQTTDADISALLKQFHQGDCLVDYARADTAQAVQSHYTPSAIPIVLAKHHPPQADALQLLSNLQQLHLALPFIVVSAQAGEDLAVAALKAGADDFLFEGRLQRLVPACQHAMQQAERRRLEQALRDNEPCSRAILENAADGIMTVDEHGIIQSLNPAAGRIFGYPPGEIIGRHIRQLIPRPYLREHESYRPDPAPSASLRFGREVAGKHKQGHSFPLELSVSESHRGDGSLFTAIARDVTERKRAEHELTLSREQLRSLAARLQTIREEERTRISREIHDELGQALTGVKMDLAWVNSKLPVDRSDLQQRTRAALHLVDHTIQTVRKIAAELRPGILDNIGLAAAIEWQANDFQCRTGIECCCTARVEDTHLDPERRTAIFRIFQETFTNVMRHAHATAVDVLVEEREGAIYLQVADNGRGITQIEQIDSKSLGLLGMRERASLLGGTFQITGQPGQGTTVAVHIPLRPLPKPQFALSGDFGV